MEDGVATRVLVLTTFDLDEYVYAAVRAGASGFLLKDAPREQLVAAILATDRTGYLLPPKSGPHARDPRETLAVLPDDALAIPGDLAARFQLVGKPRAWEWLVTAPDASHFGRMYEVVGAILRPLTVSGL